MIKALPEFPWSALAPLRDSAAQHPDGIVNLALGTPVDAPPDFVQRALCEAANAPGHPATEGTPALREAAAAYLRRRFGVAAEPEAILPSVGTKELIAWLPTVLGVGPGDLVAYPELAFPTYEVSARLAGATPMPVNLDHGLPDPAPRVLWLNTPSNPDGRVLSAERMREIVSWGRDRGVLVVNDECYLEYGWEQQPTSILHPDVCGGSHTGVLAVHTLSKRSNLAGYRAGFVTGDFRIVREMLEVRRHAGLILPTPIAAAMAAALADDTHVELQRERYARRRAWLRPALEARGLRVDHSHSGLYLWATRDEPCWDTAAFLAGEGILGAPGSIYGRPGENHIRLAVTATDERITSAVARLTA
ncbi:succinyldiaminopimelate transaminase [Actinoplanes palleronii]|uniref:Aminotransferase n=1 Tax=Actinoplanes palleronii TaxID=113570 RepID=A0ABQ4B2B6_9ACTN|nr:succinyldiaminopimelate transaminase [Actinoplanes palleronii]GIE64405.1 aminotransferase [Actinoplanes palleronii]